MTLQPIILLIFLVIAIFVLGFSCGMLYSLDQRLDALLNKKNR